MRSFFSVDIPFSPYTRPLGVVCSRKRSIIRRKGVCVAFARPLVKTSSLYSATATALTVPDFVRLAPISAAGDPPVLSRSA
jgi:hypothetical protein